MMGIIPIFHNNDQKIQEKKFHSTDQYQNRAKPPGDGVSGISELCGCS